MLILGKGQEDEAPAGVFFFSSRIKWLCLLSERWDGHNFGNLGQLDPS